VDDPVRLLKLVELILSLDLPVIFPVHPRTRARLDDADLLARLGADDLVTLIQPLDYSATIALAAAARAVVTDSGGLQKEAVWLGTQCITLRPNTEWVETLEDGWNTIVDLDADLVEKALANPPSGDPPRLYEAGHAGAAVVSALEARYARFAADPGVESA
jgi:UDP-N-acetylglucosamine 2-epimerase (non-hydrolysing)/UDP-GlcNAc3NAcA epimerase